MLKDLHLYLCRKISKSTETQALFAAVVLGTPGNYVFDVTLELVVSKSTKAN